MAPPFIKGGVRGISGASDMLWIANRRKKRSMTTPQPQVRIRFIDVARFGAMALVFYGHFIERIMYLKNPTAAAQYKFIYSFHMVLFIVLAGYVAKQSDLDLGFGKFLKHRLLSRLLPFVFFTVLFMIASAIFPGDFLSLKLPSVKGYIDGVINTVFGMPLFCVPSWFLMLIFSVELVHYAVFRFLKSDAAIVVAVLCFYIGGYLFNWQFNIVDVTKDRVIGWNYLFIHEALFLYAFYLLGVLMRRKAFLLKPQRPAVMLLAAAAMFFVVLFTYRLNAGHFSFPAFDAVVIMLSSHGHMFWFLLTAVAGSLMMLFIARAIPAWPPLVCMGGNTLMLMCLNGIFYHFINPPAAKWVAAHLSGSPPVIFAVGCLMTVVSLALCMPLISLLNRWVPQLVGKPKRSGPLMGSLIQ